MAQTHVQRRLSAILAADVVGYSRLVGDDEEGTIARLRTLRTEVIDPSVEKFGGRIVKTMGDGLLVEFASVVEAVRAAVEMQRTIEERNAVGAEDQRIDLRIGINLGDIVIDGDDILGDGVNVAARLENMATPGGICISDRVFAYVRDKVDVGFEDLGEQDLKNIAEPVRAYRILLDPDSVGIAIVTPKKSANARISAAAILVIILLSGAGYWWWSSTASHVSPANVQELIFGKPAEASIAVLPLENLSGDPNQNIFVKGLTEDLNAALSKVANLQVISQNSMNTYRGKTVDVTQVAKELGVRHVLEGSVQKLGDRLRVVMKLADGTKGLNIWSERYDRKIENLFDLQDEIVRNVLIELQVKLTHGETARALSRGTRNLQAWLYNIQAQAEAFKFTPHANMRARELYKAAAEADPNWAHPVGGQAWTYYEAVRRGWSKSKEEDIRQGVELAQKAIKMDPNEPIGYHHLGNLYFRMGKFEEGIALREKAVEVAPNNFYSAVGLAYLLALAGQEKRAVALYQRAKQISPLYPWWLRSSEALALHLDGQHKQAIERYKESLALAPTNISNLRVRLAAVYADLGEVEKAKEQIKLVLQERPNAKVRDYLHLLNFTDPKKTEWYAGLLRMAGLPE
jgi:adenylate cyclase